MSTTTQPPKPKRRWYQFSLKTLLVVVTLSCFVFAWIGSRMKQARENRARAAAVEDAVTAIEEMGGYPFSYYEYYEQRRPQTWLEKQFNDPGDSDDPAVSVLSVTRLYFDRIKVTDAGLEHLKWLKNPQALHLRDTSITDAGREHLKGMKCLEILDLSRTNITSDGLEHLKGMTKLRILNLAHSNVTDAGLIHLGGLTNLQHLYLVGTKVTAAGVKKLQQALPKCKIVR